MLLCNILQEERIYNIIIFNFWKATLLQIYLLSMSMQYISVQSNNSKTFEIIQAVQLCLPNQNKLSFFKLLLLVQCMSSEVGCKFA